MADNLKKEFHYYIEHQDEFVKEYNGKYIVLKDFKVIGAYNTIEEAYEITSKVHELGTFLIQKCEPGTDSYTQKFHSRVSFA